MKTTLNRSAAAGVLICMGCIVNLKVGGGIPGAVLFSAGLWFVVNFDAELFTGRVARNDYDPLQKVIMLVMNVIGAAVCGILASLCLPEIREAAQKIAAGYQDPLKVIWQSIMCGMCMYLATTQPKNKDISRLPFVVYGHCPGNCLVGDSAGGCRQRGGKLSHQVSADAEEQREMKHAIPVCHGISKESYGKKVS